ncbi:hypothetical protein ACE38W_15775 [Chitinophaga sp. Hz27]|uniref:hypothetical protein n=1 Tax=Chitinophaga sp. Hz27 TaxID=3347169 RepID=UPI0035D691BD
MDTTAIQQFTAKHLKNRIWTTQLIEDDMLISFLYKIARNQAMSLPSGEKLPMYIKHLFIQAAGLEAQYAALYNNSSMDEVEALERSILLNETQSNTFLQLLTERYTLFRQVQVKKD